jgi:hypothetical protein
MGHLSSTPRRWGLSGNPVPCRQGKLREKNVSALWAGQKFPYSQTLANHARRYSRAWQGNGRETAGKRSLRPSCGRKIRRPRDPRNGPQGPAVRGRDPGPAPGTNKGQRQKFLGSRFRGNDERSTKQDSAIGLQPRRRGSQEPALGPRPCPRNGPQGRPSGAGGVWANLAPTPTGRPECYRVSVFPAEPIACVDRRWSTATPWNGTTRPWRDAPPLGRPVSYRCNCRRYRSWTPAASRVPSMHSGKTMESGARPDRPLLGFRAKDAILCVATGAPTVRHSRVLTAVSSNSAAMSPMRRFSFIARRRSQR